MAITSALLLVFISFLGPQLGSIHSDALLQSLRRRFLLRRLHAGTPSASPRLRSRFLLRTCRRLGWGVGPWLRVSPF